MTCYRLITENANDLIALINPIKSSVPKFEFEYINEAAFHKILGYLSEDLIGRRAGEIVHPADLDHLFHNFPS